MSILATQPRKLEGTMIAGGDRLDVDSTKPRFDWYPFFESALVVIVIGALGFVLNLEDFRNNPAHFMPMMILQILVSAYAGYQIFPRIFKNRDLETYQETAVSAVIPILKAKSKDNVNFAFSEAISRVVGGIDRRTIGRFMVNQNNSIKSFFINYDESGSLNTSVLEGRVLKILEEGPVLLDSLPLEGDENQEQILSHHSEESINTESSKVGEV